LDRLTGAERHVLVVAAIEWADAGGWFFPKISTWATAARTAPRTVQRAICAAEEEGLLEVFRYLRPDGTGHGASSYRFDPSLLSAAAAAGASAPAPPPLNEPIDTTFGSNGTGVQKATASPKRGRALQIMEPCFDCNSPGPCTDDGNRILCDACRRLRESQGADVV
jgi:hypothetical protein